MPIWSDDFSGYSNYRLDWLWSTKSQDIPNNRSLIQRKLSITRTGGSGTARLNADSTWSITGGPARSGSFGYDFRNYTTLVLLDEQVWITHDADGTLSVSTTARADTVSGTPLGDALIPAKTVTSPTIARASRATFSPSSTFDAGAAVTIETHRASTAFTHNITYSFGSQTGTVGNAVATDINWTPPLSMLSEIPNATSGPGYISVATYNGSTLVGTTTTAFTLRAPSTVVPSISAINVTDDNPATAAIGGFVQGQSLLKATVVSAGAYGSTIASSVFSVDGGTAASGLTLPLPLSGTRVVSAAVVDSRGRSGAKTGNVTVLPYDVPKINDFTVERATAAGVPSPTDTSLRMTLNASASSLLVGTQKNSLTITVKTRERGTTSWTTRNVINTGLSYNTSVLITGGDIFAAAKAWEASIEVKDKLQTTIDFFTVSTAGAIVDATGDKQAFGKMVEASGPTSQMQGPGRLYDVWDVDGRKVLDAGDLASNADTQTGTATDKAVTPAALSSRTATETRTGLAELATQAEVDAGDSTRIMTADKTRNAAWGAYAEARGQVTCAATGVTTVTFPASRFSVAPNVQATPVGNATVGIAHVSARTSTSFEVRFYSFSGGQLAGTVDWFASQATAGSAAG